MSTLISFDGASDFQIRGGNFGKVRGDFTTITLHSSESSDLDLLVPSNRSHRHRRRHHSRNTGQTIREPVTGTTLTRPPAPLESTARSPRRSHVSPSDVGSPRDENSVHHQSQSGPRFPSSSSPPHELSPFTDTLGLRQFTPSETSQAIGSREERRNNPSLRAQTDAPPSRTQTRSHRTASVQTLHSPRFERPPNPSPPSSYSYGPPPIGYSQRSTRGMGDTTNFSPNAHSNTMSSHHIALPVYYAQPIPTPKSVQPHMPTPIRSPHFEGRRVPMRDVPPTEAVRAHWTALYPNPVYVNAPRDVRYATEGNNIGPTSFCLEPNCECRGYPDYEASYYDTVPRHPSQSPSGFVFSNRRPTVPQQYSLASSSRYPADGYAYVVA